MIGTWIWTENPEDPCPGCVAPAVSMYDDDPVLVFRGWHEDCLEALNTALDTLHLAA